jgi:uncharacterized protein
MTRVDEIEAQITKAKAERAELENEDHRQISEAESRIASLRGELASDRNARDGAAASIDASLRKKYEFLLERRSGLAVVEVDETGCCSGCHVQIPPQTLLEVRRTQSLRVCPMCQRILFATSPASAEQ